MLFHNQKILVLGLGLSGRAAAQYLFRRGAWVCGVDQNRELIEGNLEISQLKSKGVQILYEGQLKNLGGFDKIVVSPGVPPTNPIYQMALKEGVGIIGEVELACQGMVNRCVAITGSNGKTTTTLLVEHALNMSGVKAKAVGNVGTPLTAALDEFSQDTSSVIVLELSSWQLETLSSQVLDAGVILNITPNHLDRHLTMESYAKAKLRLNNCLKPNKPLYMGLQCYREYGVPSAKTFGYDRECTLYCDTEAVRTRDQIEFFLPEIYRNRISHDVENIMAAYALCREVGITGPQFAQTLPSFKKPPHRIEFVRKIQGVAYYDDSKATSLDAVVKAVNSMEGQTLLIAGGVHKGAAYTPWLAAFAGKVRCICAIGEAAEKIEEDLANQIPVRKFKTLEEGLMYASKLARPGENVLLSPGCSSYDMFKNYEQRGDEFKRIIREIPATEGKES